MIRALVILLVCATPALAQPSGREGAKAHFKSGKALQDAGKYSEAADEYQAAYDLDPRPAMLFNIAQAHRLAGHKKTALDYYQRYLSDEPSGAGAREARQWVVELQRQLDAEKPVVPETPTVTAPVTPPSGMQPPPHEPVQVRTTKKSSPQLRITGLVVGGVGLASLAAGVAFGFKARSASDTISKHDMGSWTEDEMDTFYAGQRANRNMVIAYVAGGALVTTGGVLYMLGARTRVVPVVGAQTAGLATWGRF